MYMNSTCQEYHCSLHKTEEGPVLMSHFTYQIVTKRVQSRKVSSEISLCVHGGFIHLMYSACQECRNPLHKKGDQW